MLITEEYIFIYFLCLPYSCPHFFKNIVSRVRFYIHPISISTFMSKFVSMFVLPRQKDNFRLYITFILVKNRLNMILGEGLITQKGSYFYELAAKGVVESISQTIIVTNSNRETASILKSSTQPYITIFLKLFFQFCETRLEI